MSIALVIVGDGRDDYHERSVASARTALPMGLFDQHVVVDDREHELGFAGAVQRGWDQVAADWIFWLEADFIFNALVPLERMIAILERHPELAQMVLKRQAVNGDEIAAGGVIEQHPADYTERTEGDDTWIEHRRYWSTNPGVYSARWCRLGWPQEDQSEGMFTHRLLRDPLLRFACWGALSDPPLVHHIGAVRAGHGY